MTADTFRAVIADILARHDRVEITAVDVFLEASRALDAVDPAAIEAAVDGIDMLPGEAATVVDEYCKGLITEHELATVLGHALRRPYGATEAVEPFDRPVIVDGRPAYAIDALHPPVADPDADFDHDAPRPGRHPFTGDGAAAAWAERCTVCGEGVGRPAHR